MTEVRRTAVLEQRNLVGGELVDAVEGATREILNPATGETIARVPEGAAADVQRAVAAASKARIPWRDTTPAGARSCCSRSPTPSTATARSWRPWSR